MIRVYPDINYSEPCSLCGKRKIIERLFWQGIHVCVKARCNSCKSEFVSDLPVGHSIMYPFEISLTDKKLIGQNLARKWYGYPFFKSIFNPQSGRVKFKVIKNKKVRNPLIINCLDYLYGHSLLKLLNIASIKNQKDFDGLIVLVPKILIWLIPQWVAEIWVVDLPLRELKNYYPDLESKILKQISRFNTVYLDNCRPHPTPTSPLPFTSYDGHDFQSKTYGLIFKSDAFA